MSHKCFLRTVTDILRTCAVVIFRVNMSCISSVDVIRLWSLTRFLPVRWLCLTVFKAPIYFWLVTLDLTFSWLLIFFFPLGNYLITKINKSVLVILFSLSPTINWSVPTILILIHLPKLVIENWQKKLRSSVARSLISTMLKGKTLGHGELIFCDWEECAFSLSLILEIIDYQTCQVNYFLTC